MNIFLKLLSYIKLGVGTYQAIRHVEATTSDPKSGPTKLDTVIGIVGAASQAVPEIAEHIQQKDAASFAANLTPLLVNVLNQTGVFKK